MNFVSLEDAYKDNCISSQFPTPISRQYKKNPVRTDDDNCKYCTSTEICITNDGAKIKFCDGCGYLYKSPGLLKKLYNNWGFYIKYDVLKHSNSELVANVEEKNRKEAARRI